MISSSWAQMIWMVLRGDTGGTRLLNGDVSVRYAQIRCSLLVSALSPFVSACGSRFLLLLILLFPVLSAQAAWGDRISERLRERMAERQQQQSERNANAAVDQSDLTELGWGSHGLSCSEWASKIAKQINREPVGPTPNLTDIRYGNLPHEVLDVFWPTQLSAGKDAPVIILVHGGAWCIGDKQLASVTTNKVDRWVNRGFVLVSVNYPMVGDGVVAAGQVESVARAVAFVQEHALDWGGDPSKVILMGNSAGGHLVSLLNASAKIREKAQIRPLLGVISLDAAALNVSEQMGKVYPFLKRRYRDAFGTTPAEWLPVSPYKQLSAGAYPWLGVCSTLRKDDPCAQNRAYADKSHLLGLKAEVLPVAMTHGEINEELGIPGAYTLQVEAFMRSLDPQVAEMLQP